jgi:ABC-2 type transport system ATP-binding protein
MEQLENIISIHHLKKSYKISSGIIHVLKDVNLELGNGVTAILGPNGAGKTTLIKICTDLLEFEGGNVTYYGNDLKTMTKKEKSQTFSLLSEGSRNLYYKLTPLENIKYFSTVRGISFESIKEYSLNLLQELNLYEKKNELVENLSRGMQQKVAVVCALSMNTPVTFLDEPTLGLDMESSINLSKFLRNPEFSSGRSIIITSHDFSFVEKTASQIYKLQDGVMIKKEDFGENDDTFIIRINHPDIDKIKNESLEVIDTCSLYCTIKISTSSLRLGEEIQKLNNAGHDIVYVEAENQNITNFYLNKKQ